MREIIFSHTNNHLTLWQIAGWQMLDSNSNSSRGSFVPLNDGMQPFYNWILMDE